MFGNMNIKKVVLWLFAIMVVCFIIAGSYFITDGVKGTLFSSNDSNAKSYDIDTEKAFDAAGLKDVDIGTVSTNVTVIPTDKNEFKAHLYGNTYSIGNSPATELIADVSGSRLKVEVKHKVKLSVGFHFMNTENLKLDVYVPASYAENMKITTVSGEAAIDTLNLNNFVFHTVSGELDAGTLNTKDCSFGSTSGDVKVESFTGNLDFKSVSGSITAAYSSFSNNIKVDTTSGGAKINLPENAGFELIFSSVSGNLNSEFPITTRGTSVKKHDIDGTIGSGKYNVDIHTVSGDAKLEKN